MNENEHQLEMEHHKYLCSGATGAGQGETPRSAIEAAIENGMELNKATWAVWENLVPGGIFRLHESLRAISVELPEGISSDDFDFWTHLNRPERLRMIACGQNFARRIIRVRSERIEASRKRVSEPEEFDTDEVVAEAAKLLGCD
jgi:hypothetical protein